MKIVINDRRKIHAIQEDFSKQFPYLRLEFFSKPHTLGGTSSKKRVKRSSKTLGECRTIHDSGVITITPQMTVTDLEQNFRDAYGLSIQIFRKSGEVWSEINSANVWTLEEENRQGELLSKLTT